VKVCEYVLYHISTNIKVSHEFMSKDHRQIGQYLVSTSPAVTLNQMAGSHAIFGSTDIHVYTPYLCFTCMHR